MSGRNVEVSYLTKKGAGVTRYVAMSELPRELEKLAKRHVKATARIRGETVGETAWTGRGTRFNPAWTWWCETEDFDGFEGNAKWVRRVPE